MRLILGMDNSMGGMMIGAIQEVSKVSSN